jgi:superfamily II DNA helicase RecQ
MGKSMIYLAPALHIPANQFFVVVVPRVVLIAKNLQECQKYGVKCEQYQSGMRIVDRKTKILFVGLEQTITEQFMTLINSCNTPVQSRVWALVIDEIHLMFEMFRTPNCNLFQLWPLLIPTIGLTGTSIIRICTWQLTN